MKITITLLLITLGLVCSAYAAPAPTKAEIQQWWQKFAQAILEILGPLGGEAQDYGDNDNDAQIEAVLQGHKGNTDIRVDGELLLSLPEKEILGVIGN